MSKAEDGRAVLHFLFSISSDCSHSRGLLYSQPHPAGALQSGLQTTQGFMNENSCSALTSRLLLLRRALKKERLYNIPKLCSTCQSCPSVSFVGVSEQRRGRSSGNAGATTQAWKTQLHLGAFQRRAFSCGEMLCQEAQQRLLANKVKASLLLPCTSKPCELPKRDRNRGHGCADIQNEQKSLQRALSAAL